MLGTERGNQSPFLTFLVQLQHNSQRPIQLITQPPDKREDNSRQVVVYVYRNEGLARRRDFNLSQSIRQGLSDGRFVTSIKGGGRLFGSRVSARRVVMEFIQYRSQESTTNRDRRKAIMRHPADDLTDEDSHRSFQRIEYDTSRGKPSKGVKREI
jgi:hypothetical protein